MLHYSSVKLNSLNYWMKIYTNVPLESCDIVFVMPAFDEGDNIFRAIDALVHQYAVHFRFRCSGSVHF